MQRDVMLGLVLLLGAGVAGAIVMLNGSNTNGAQTDFASTRTETAPPAAVPFSGQQAMTYLKQICALGPRISGTPQHAKMVDILKKHFEEHGFQVELQKFDIKQNSRLVPTPMVNLVARWKPEKTERLLVCTHYDTRPIAHNDARRNWALPFVGANDGGSGPAWMMEMARHMKQLDPELGIDFVCFDGEEFVFETSETSNNPDQYFFGSRHFAQDYARSRNQSNAMRYREGVLMDMIAGKGPNHPRFLFEGNSLEKAEHVVDRIWRIARDQRCRAFVPERGKKVEDDHLALLAVGVPVIDIIPVYSEREPDLPGRFLSYAHWHLITDTVDNCGPDGMEQVAKVLSVWMKTAK
jgi:glutaminyl-peptide cyclotransferase